MWSFTKTCRLLVILGLVLDVAGTPAVAVVPDKLLPDDAELVISVNLKELIASDLVKKYALDKIRAQLRENIDVAGVLAQLNFDPLRDLDTVVITVRDIKVDSPEGAQPPRPGAAPVPNAKAGEVFIIARGKFELTRFHRVLGDFAKESPDKLAVSDHGKFKVYEGKEGDRPMFVAFVDGGTLVASDKKARVTAALDRSQGKGTPGTLRKELGVLLAKADDKRTIWAVMPVPAAVRDMAKNAPQGAPGPQAQGAAILQKLEGLTLGVSIRDDIAADINIHSADTDAATKLGQMIDQMKFIAAAMAMQNKEVGPAIAEVVSASRTTVKDKTTTINIKVSADLIDRAVKRAQEGGDKKPGDNDKR